MRFTLDYLAKFVNTLPKDWLTLQEMLINLGIEVENVTKTDDGKDVIEIAVAPNRADLLGIMGIARELSLVYNCKVSIPELSTLNIASTSSTATRASVHMLPLKLDLVASSACPKYHARVFTGCNVNAPTPSWIAEVLNHAGIKLINIIVDLTNYVMLELGQPLHAFDYDKIRGNILQIRLASAGEQIVLLNEQTLVLAQDDLVVADSRGALALAGIMGGSYAAIGTSTSNIVLESAYFAPIGIRMSCNRYNLSSDAAMRFSRNVDPNLSELASMRCSELLLSIAGGKEIQQQSIVIDKSLPKTNKIELSTLAITKLLGIEITSARIEQILLKLGANLIVRSTDGWLVEPPSWRPDLTMTADLIEEIARCIGYNNIVPTTVSLPLNFTAVDNTKVNFAQELKLKRCLAARGYNEVINYSFIDPALVNKFYPAANAYAITNPISANMSIIRPGLWAGLFSNLVYNHKRQSSRVRLFELGTVFVVDSLDLDIVMEIPKLAGLISAQDLPENWQKSVKAVDFFGLKSDVLALLNLYGWNDEIQFSLAKISGLHPTKAANIQIDSTVLGSIGAIHPDLLQQYEIALPVYVFELDVTKLLNCRKTKFTHVSKFPAVRRDFSLLLDHTLPVALLYQSIKDSFKELLQDLIFFDVYTGINIPPGKKSIALGVILQHPSRTLLDEEVNQLVAQLLDNLRQLGIELRSQ